MKFSVYYDKLLNIPSSNSTNYTNYISTITICDTSQVPLVCRNSLFKIQLTSDELRYIINCSILKFSTANSRDTLDRGVENCLVSFNWSKRSSKSCNQISNWLAKRPKRVQPLDASV
ncbi:hypothetical protein T01_9298 [Trichinella spiralis]|uniref:Uncharacterized protein n=1 Tax=Trichinella spiralis TaxID=6334 RepID=A0A0V1B3N1_TRISP|nr:hypothetical protein T01_9298 [Trichinella spiralis]